MQRWNDLAVTPGLSVRGLVVGRGGVSRAQWDVFQQTGSRMPLGSISARDASLMAGRLGFRMTPFAVVLDVHGRVAASFPAGRNVPPEILSRMMAGS